MRICMLHRFGLSRCTPHHFFLCFLQVILLSFNLSLPAAVRVFQNDLFGEDNKHNDALAEFHQGVDLHERSPTSSGTPTRYNSPCKLEEQVQST